MGGVLQQGKEGPLVGEVARNKALAIALGKVNVVDSNGKSVDLSSLVAVDDEDEAAEAPAEEKAAKKPAAKKAPAKKPAAKKDEADKPAEKKPATRAAAKKAAEKAE